MVKFIAISLSLVTVVQVIAGASSYSDTQIDEIVKNSGENSEIYTTHSETHRPIHVPVYERYPINVPHPEPVAVPQYIRVSIPQPYPKYTHIQHEIKIPVYKIIPEIIEKPVSYTVEKPYPVEIEKPFPIEIVKKLEIPVPQPYPVHVVYYKHISEDDPPPKSPKMVYGFNPYTNKYATEEDFQKNLKASKFRGLTSNHFGNDESFFKAPKTFQNNQDSSIIYFSDGDSAYKSTKTPNAFNDKENDEDGIKIFNGNFLKQISNQNFLKENDTNFSLNNFKIFNGNTIKQNSIQDFLNSHYEDSRLKNFKILRGNSVNQDFLKSAKLFYNKEGKYKKDEGDLSSNKPFSYNQNQLAQLTDEDFPINSQNIFSFNENTDYQSFLPNSQNYKNLGKNFNKDSRKALKIFSAQNKNTKNKLIDEDVPPKSKNLSNSFRSKYNKYNSLQYGGEFSPTSSHHEHRFSGY